MTIVPFALLSVLSMNSLEVRHRRFHHLGRLEHEGELHLPAAEELADDLHAVKEDRVDDVERRITLQRLIQITPGGRLCRRR